MAKPTTGRGPGTAVGAGPIAPGPGMETEARPLCRELGLETRPDALSAGLAPEPKAGSLFDVNGACNGPLEL
mgnify:CR=1 FL=1